MDYKQMTSPCGLACFACPVHLAKTNQDIRQKISADTGIPAEKIECDGCRNACGMIKFLGKEKPCETYSCVKAKGLDFCYECNDFPCDRYQPCARRATVCPHNTKVYNNCLIQKMGLEKWAKEKAADVLKRYFSEDVPLLCRDVKYELKGQHE